MNTLFDIYDKQLDSTIDVQFQTPIAVCKYMAVELNINKIDMTIINLYKLSGSIGIVIFF